MNLNANLITYLVASGVSMALTDLGVSAGELSQTQATKRYGSWFTHAVEKERIKPVRQGNGKSATKYYRVSDILALRAIDSQEVSLSVK